MQLGESLLSLVVVNAMSKQCMHVSRKVGDGTHAGCMVVFGEGGDMREVGYGVEDGTEGGRQ